MKVYIVGLANAYIGVLYHDISLRDKYLALEPFLIGLNNASNGTSPI